MKHNFIFFFSIIILAICFSSCSFETDKVDGDNDFEGFWHLESIETVSTDSTSESITKDYSKQRIFWAFQMKLLELQDFDNDRIPSVFCRFNIVNGKITITEAYRFSDAEQQDVPLDNDSVLIHYGIPALNTTYDYSIDGSKMILSAGNTRLRLTKF